MRAMCLGGSLPFLYSGLSGQPWHTQALPLLVSGGDGNRSNGQWHQLSCRLQRSRSTSHGSPIGRFPKIQHMPEVKRCAASLGGFVYGVGLTWVCLWMLSQHNWTQHQGRTVTGCHEIGKCSLPWWDWLFVISYLFGPAIILATVNAVAWRRWSVTKWACFCFGVTALVLGLYAADHYV
jgi:hypothetical protein